MSALIESWFCSERCPTYAPPPISSAATTAVEIARVRGGRGDICTSIVVSTPRGTSRSDS